MATCYVERRGMVLVRQPTNAHRPMHQELLYVPHQNVSAACPWQHFPQHFDSFSFFTRGGRLLGGRYNVCEARQNTWFGDREKEPNVIPKTSKTRTPFLFRGSGQGQRSEECRLRRHTIAGAETGPAVRRGYTPGALTLLNATDSLRQGSRWGSFKLLLSAASLQRVARIRVVYVVENDLPRRTSSPLNKTKCRSSSMKSSPDIGGRRFSLGGVRQGRGQGKVHFTSHIRKLRTPWRR